MSHTVKRHTFNLRKTTTSVNFQVPIDLEEAFKNVKPPVVPSLFKSVCEEILARIASRQLSILPSPLSVLFFNADSMSGNTISSTEIDDVIKMLHFGKKDMSGKQRALKRSVDLQPYRTSVLIRALFRYVEDCSDGIHLDLEVPDFGYLLAGPPPLKADTKPDVRAYTRSMDSFLLVAVKRSPVKRDIFCYLMNFLSQIYQLMRDNYRSEPALCGMTRYILANRFGAEMVAIKCTECNMRIEMESKKCSTSNFIKSHIKPPYYAQVFDMMLEYIPLSYWREALNDPRRGLADRDKITTNISDLQFIVKSLTQGDNGKFMATKTSQELARGGKSHALAHDLADMKGISAKVYNIGGRSQEARNEKEEKERNVKTSPDDGDESDIVGGRGETILAPLKSKSGGSMGINHRSSMGTPRDRDMITSDTINRKSLHAEADQPTLFSHLSSPFNDSSESLRSDEIINRATDSPKTTSKGKKIRKKSQRAISRMKNPRDGSVSNKKPKKRKIRSKKRERRSRSKSPKMKKRKRKAGKAEKRSRKHSNKTPRSKTKARGRSIGRR